MCYLLSNDLPTAHSFEYSKCFRCHALSISSSYGQERFSTFQKRRLSIVRYVLNFDQYRNSVSVTVTEMSGPKAIQQIFPEVSPNVCHPCCTRLRCEQWLAKTYITCKAETKASTTYRPNYFLIPRAQVKTNTMSQKTGTFG